MNYELRILNYQHRGVCRYALFTAGETEVLRGGGLDGDVVDETADDLSQTLLHGWNMGVEFGALRAYGGIDIAHMVSLGGLDILTSAMRANMRLFL